MKKTVPIGLIIALSLLAPLTYCLTINSTQAATYPNTINFSGYTWWIENTNTQRAHPGPNYWSNSPQNVWVDTNGYLHLKITYINGKYYCPEITTTQTLGYGTYIFKVASRIDGFDKNIVAGLFARIDDNREIDIEFSKWGLSNYQNSRYTIQPAPYIENQNKHTFNTVLYGDYTTQYFKWTPSGVYFASVGGHYQPGTEPADNVIQSYTLNRQVSAAGAKAHINLWLYQGLYPSDGSQPELVIKSFQYIP
jgi:hypothetical protein